MCRLPWLRAYSPQHQCAHVTVTVGIYFSAHVTQTQCSLMYDNRRGAWCGSRL